MEILYYKGYLGRNSMCGYDRNGNHFIIYELDSNSGTSITNAITTIATIFCTQFDIKPSELVIIEKYPENAKSKLPAYALAELKERPHYFNGQDVLFDCPNYRPLGELEISKMLNAH